MLNFTLIGLWASAVLGSPKSYSTPPVSKEPLQVLTHVNPGPSLDMVSSLIIGSTSAVLIDMPLAIFQAEDLASWVQNVTDKPLVAVFTTHFHPDHYLSGSAFLKYFPETKYYANSKAVALIENERQAKAVYWRGALGNDTVIEEPAIPTPYDFTFFSLPNDEASHIHLISPLGGDTIDKFLFWIPSTGTLIAGDAVYSHQMHLWLADLLTPSLTEAWLSTLDFVSYLSPCLIIPGHALTSDSFSASADLEHTRAYVTYFQQQIEKRAVDFYTPGEIYTMLDGAFPGLVSDSLGSTTSATLLNISAEQFGRGGTRQVHYVDLAAYNNATALEGWEL